MALYFITGNQNKLAEVRSVVSEIEQLDIDLPEVQEIDPHFIVKAKLEAAKAHHQGEFIVEDTSLYLQCLNGLPGPLIKWFLIAIQNQGLYNIAKAYNNFNAEVRTIIGHAGADGAIEFFEGSLAGTIVEPRETGFGWDPVFLPEGHDQTFAEMSKDEKNKISMRSIAARKLKQHLDDQRNTAR